MYHMGHGGAAAAVLALLFSAGFLVWVGDKAGNPYQKLGKIVGAVALALSALLVVGAIYTCIMMRLGNAPMGGCPMMRGMGMPRMGMWKEMPPEHRMMHKGQGMEPAGEHRGHEGEAPQAH